MTTSEDVIRAAASVGRNAAEGKLSPASLDVAVAEECKALFGTVVGEGDPLWSLHQDVCRQSIALGALTADELAEWAAVMRRRAGEVTDPEVEVAPVSGPLSLETDATEPETEVTDQDEEVPDEN